MGTEKEQEKEGEDWRRIGRASALWQERTEKQTTAKARPGQQASSTDEDGTEGLQIRRGNFKWSL
jgi:hypothetical protein